MFNSVLCSRSDYNTETNKQGGNSNLDCVPHTDVVAMFDRGVLSSNFVHQMCHQGGGGGLSARFFPKLWKALSTCVLKGLGHIS